MAGVSDEQAQADFLPSDRMPEAETALRLALHLLDHPEGENHVEVALDGAQVTYKKKTVFAVRRFLQEMGYSADSENPQQWQTTYRQGERTILVHSKSGVGDVVGRVAGRGVFAECKKGSFFKTKSNPEYRLVREALGQLLTTEQAYDDDVLLAAVPDTDAYRHLTKKWRELPAVRRAGLHIVLVGRDGTVEGMPQALRGSKAIHQKRGRT